VNEDPSGCLSLLGMSLAIVILVIVAALIV
jgi:hypothetical protein